MRLAVDLYREEGVDAPLDQDEMTRTLELVLEQEGVERPCYLSLSIVGEEEIRRRNLEWRGVDAATDVISLECERPDDPDLAPAEPCELGDIVIAPTYVGRQARRLGTTERDEMRLMLVHGMLHLLGYDHVEESDALEMEAREDELLVLAGTLAPGEHVELTRHGSGSQS